MPEHERAPYAVALATAGESSGDDELRDEGEHEELRQTNAARTPRRRLREAGSESVKSAALPDGWESSPPVPRRIANQRPQLREVLPEPVQPE